MRASEYIRDLAANGTYHFTTADAIKAIKGTPPAVRAQLRRLKEQEMIAEPVRGFHVIVPPEYRRLGCLPAEYFIDQLMRHWNEPYCVCLLSAAERHGAAHQRPQAAHRSWCARTGSVSSAGWYASSSSPAATSTRCR
jgi:hypothetical protein